MTAASTASPSVVRCADCHTMFDDRTAHATCPACGGLLVAPEAAFVQIVPPNTDYVCLQCERPYRWGGTPPRLKLAVVEGPRRDDPHEQ